MKPGVLRTDYSRRFPRRRLLSYAKLRAKRKGVPFSLTEADIRIPARCPVLGIRLLKNWGGKQQADASPTLDRLRPELGYVKGNVIVVSERANRLRGNATVAELRQLWEFYRMKAVE